MKESELVANIAELAGVSQADAGRAVDAFVAIAAETLARGGDIRLTGFGCFEVVATGPHRPPPAHRRGDRHRSLQSAEVPARRPAEGRRHGRQRDRSRRLKPFRDRLTQHSINFFVRIGANPDQPSRFFLSDSAGLFSPGFQVMISGYHGLRQAGWERVGQDGYRVPGDGGNAQRAALRPAFR